VCFSEKIMWPDATVGVTFMVRKEGWWEDWGTSMTLELQPGEFGCSVVFSFSGCFLLFLFFCVVVLGLGRVYLFYQQPGKVRIL